MTSTDGTRVHDASAPPIHGPPTTSTPFRIRTTSPSAAPAVTKPTGRGSVTPLRIGRCLVAPGDRIALAHLLDHHLEARDLRQRLGRWVALKALESGMEGLAVSALHRSHGAESPGPLEVEAVWVAVRDTLKSCGLTGVRIRVHILNEPAAGIGYGGTLVGFGRRGSTLESTHPLVALRVRPVGAAGPGLEGEAQALASVRAPLPPALRALVPTPLAHRVTDGIEVLATSFVSGRPLPFDLPRRAHAGRAAHRHMAAVAGTLADLQNALRDRCDRVLDGSVWPEAAAEYPWSARLRERLSVRPVPLLPSHGDFAPHNLLVEGGLVSGIVDWSRHRSAELPTRDLFHFLIAYARLLDPSPAGVAARAIERAFIERNRVSHAIRQALLRYSERRELGLPTLGGLFRLHLLVADQADDPRNPLPTAADRKAALRLLDAAHETVFTP